MKKIIFILILLCFLITSIVGVNPVFAQEFHLPEPGTMVSLSPGFKPPVLKGLKINPDNPFRFDFILDRGDGRRDAINGVSTKEKIKLIKYFLASLTIPEKDFWVNLSPYEKNRIIPFSFGLTEMGRDLLAEDYMLKQITASLIYPEDKVGKTFWKRVYEQVAKRYGACDVPVRTFNKVWIVPEKAVVYENVKVKAAYVLESKLKVMLEEDYLSFKKYEGTQSCHRDAINGVSTNQSGSQIVREIVIPELTKEVNENENFARLRQVYHSLILATWYKKKIKDSILDQVYVDKNKVMGVHVDDNRQINDIYQMYLKAFKKGVFNYVKEQIDTKTQEFVPRKFFSGGLSLAMASQGPQATLKIVDSAMIDNPGGDREEEIGVELTSVQGHLDQSPLKGDVLFTPIPVGGKILAFGSSSTKGVVNRGDSYPAILEKMIGHPVINAGIPAERVVNVGHPNESKYIDGVTRLPELLETHHPSLVILWHGKNDLNDKKDRRITIDGLEGMIHMAWQRGCQVLLLGTNENDQTGKEDDPVFRQVAQETEVPYLNEFEQGVLGNDEYMFDAMHADGPGNKLLAQKVAQFLWKHGALSSGPNTSIKVEPSRKVLFEEYSPDLYDNFQYVGSDGVVYFKVGFGQQGIDKNQIKLRVKLNFGEHVWSDRVVHADMVEEYPYNYYLFKAVLPAGVKRYTLMASYDGKPESDRTKFWVFSNTVIKVAGEFHAGAQFTAIPQDGTILAFGSSSTSGVIEPEYAYPALLEKLIGFKVINAGFPGERVINHRHPHETYTDGYSRLPSDLERYHPSLVILWHGRNDWFDGKDEGLIEYTLNQMVNEAKAHHCQVLLLGSHKPGQSRDADVYRRVAEHQDIPYLSEIETDILGAEWFMHDGIHANSQGNLLFANRIAQFLWRKGALLHYPDLSLTVPPSIKVYFQQYEPSLHGRDQLVGEDGAVYFTVGFTRQEVPVENIRVQVKLKMRGQGWTEYFVDAQIIHDYRWGYYRFKATLPPDAEGYTLRASYDGKDNSQDKVWVWSNVDVQVIRDAAQITPEKRGLPAGGIDLTTTHKDLLTQKSQESIQFHLNPAQLGLLQKARGFIPAIVYIKPLVNLRRWLGLDGSLGGLQTAF
ncbi:MAG: hypothetical protein HQL13_00095 [Candidatus Omnitrophica bacterium]|nr:hypothetical protein [Candidatus Omnitrophota bacterium]